MRLLLPKWLQKAVATICGVVGMLLLLATLEMDRLSWSEYIMTELGTKVAAICLIILSIKLWEKIDRKSYFQKVFTDKF